MNNGIENIYVLGTDTGVGKTVLSLLLMQFFYARGDTPFYLKPLQTGCRDPYDTDSDARFIYQNVKALIKKDPADSVIYCFRNPKAPYFAARDEGSSIDLEVIGNVINDKSVSFQPVILEAAGGLYVPVNEETLIIDTIKIFGAKPVVAARAGLGTINHTLLTLKALTCRDIVPKGVVFMDSDEKPTSPDMIRENIEAVEKFSGIKVAGVIGRITDFSNPETKHFEIIRRLVN